LEQIFESRALATLQRSHSGRSSTKLQARAKLADAQTGCPRFPFRLALPLLKRWQRPLTFKNLSISQKYGLVNTLVIKDLCHKFFGQSSRSLSFFLFRKKVKKVRDHLLTKEGNR